MVHLVRTMLVEDEPEVCEGFRTAFRRYQALSLVYVTDSELQALDYMETHEVDVLILDIELREGDGMSLLYEIEARGLEKPFIIVVTNTQSRVTLSFMRTHGADYIYQKANRSYSPKRVLSVIEKIYPYQLVEDAKRCMHTVSSFEEKKENEITKKYIEDELEKMGFRRKNVGFSYTSEAIFLLAGNKENCLRVSSQIYPLIAETHHTTKDAVERGIRNAIESVFTGAPAEELYRYYPFSYDEERGRPTNAEFLKNMAERLRI